MQKLLYPLFISDVSSYIEMFDTVNSSMTNEQKD